MKVNEVFLSIQGEGLNVGKPVVFIRLQGCNLDPLCSWCDTQYAQNTKECKDTEVDYVVAEALRVALPIHCERFCITGGEPLHQKGALIALISKLQASGAKSIEVFSNGSIEVPYWVDRVRWCIDVKCPSSGTKISTDQYQQWFDCLTFEDSVKFVVADDKDLEFCEAYLSHIPKSGPHILISPVFSAGELLVMQRDWLQKVWMFAIKHRLQFSLQIHKVVFGNKKGI